MDLSSQYIADYYQNHIADVRLFAYRFTGNMDVAKDIAQETFLRLLGIDNIISPELLPRLAIRVARNLVIDHFRRRATYEEYEHVIMSYGNSPMEVLTLYSMFGITEHLERGMARLPESSRSIYRMHLIDGMKVSEISKALDINYKSVERQLGMARKVIRKYMAPLVG